jgi:hypothetical protein
LQIHREPDNFHPAREACRILELETQGLLQRLAPGDAEHVEHWSLLRGVEASEDEESVARAVLPLVAAERNH